MRYLISVLMCVTVVSGCGCAALEAVLGAAADPSTPAGVVVDVASAWLPWLPWAVAGANALLGVWAVIRGRRAKAGAIAIAQAVETAQAEPVKQLVAASTRDTSVGAWIDAMLDRYVSRS